ncbi:MAG: CoA transferase, partial [Burkholderiales bacterium]
ILGGAVPCAPVHDVKEALDNPFVAEREGVQAIDHPDRPGFKLVASPFRLDEPLPANPAPKLGEHTDVLLAELGYSGPDIAALKASKAAG